MSQQFDAVASAVARDRAIALADANAKAMWQAAAANAVARLARSKPLITTDDVWRILADEAEWREVETHEPRAMGGVMRRAAKAGLVVATDRTKMSVRVKCHRRPIRVWQSLIFRGEP